VIVDEASSRELGGFTMQQTSPLDIFHVSPQIIDFYRIMLVLESRCEVQNKLEAK
jgi:hypothetical protein